MNHAIRLLASSGAGLLLALVLGCDTTDLRPVPPADQQRNLRYSFGPHAGPGWDLPCRQDGQNLLWPDTRRYPVTLSVDGAGAPSSFNARFEVRAQKHPFGSDLLGILEAAWDQGNAAPTEVKYAADEGARVVPVGAVPIEDAFWLGCTSGGGAQRCLVRGNADRADGSEEMVYLVYAGGNLPHLVTPSNTSAANRVRCIAISP